MGISAAVFGGVAVVLSAVGIGLGVTVIDDARALTRRCSSSTGVCSPNQADFIRDSWARAEASNITGSLGLVLGIAAVVQLVVALREDQRSSADSGVRVDAGGIGLAF